MPTPIVATKLHIPPLRPQIVHRPRLVDRLNAGLHAKLTLVSAPAGFGKTTLVAEWIASGNQPVAWLSLDEGDNDPARFFAYLVAAVQTIAPDVGRGLLRAFESPQPPPITAVLTALLNDITATSASFVLVLDDYHRVQAQWADDALGFLIDHVPPQMHLVITTREDPALPLARLRACGELTELRAADLRFTPAEAAEFLNQVMRLDLSAEQIAALETRTEGWIAGLQLAALSLQGQHDLDSFISSFTGSHRFVLDYLVEEVLQQQPLDVQMFLLHTSILERMCGPLCDAVLGNAAASGQATLEQLERANLFIVALDNERRWYRYHQLFAELLRQRLHHAPATLAAGAVSVAEAHRRASQWYEDNGSEIEAFHHAAAANDLPRAERLIEGQGMPLQFRGGAGPILDWLAALPAVTLDARPGLWVAYASTLLMLGQVVGVAEKAQAAETALHGAALDDKTRDLIGRIASIRATLAVTQHQADTIIAQAQRALAYLRPDNLAVRAAITWTLGYAHMLQGDRAAASHAYAEAIPICAAIGHTHIAMMATIGLASIQEVDTQLYQAAQTYQRAVQLAGDPPLPPVCNAYLGLARISYQWNDLAGAQHYLDKSMPLARQIQNTDRFVVCEVFLARLKLAQGDVNGAAATLAQAEQVAHQHGFAQQLPELAAVQTLVLLQQGGLAAAAQLASAYDLPLSQARIQLAHGDGAAALALLEPLHQQMALQGWHDERLTLLVLQAVALSVHREPEQALQRLDDALGLAAPGGFIRRFVDEGAPMERLLSQAAARGTQSDYTRVLLAAFKDVTKENAPAREPASTVEALSQRELEVLELIALGKKNQAIADDLVISLNTVRYHTKNLFGKLGVNTRTHAVARAQELGLL